MEEYEKVSQDCQIRWEEKIKLTDEIYKQVSGYIFNEKNQLLIVKTNKNWTIPGGHPEVTDETPIETLKREVMEEAYTEIKDINYLGAVKVIENDEIYYQLRYTAKVDTVSPFKREWETSERAFVDLDKLQNYITWSKGITFIKELEAARKKWNI